MAMFLSEGRKSALSRWRLEQLRITVYLAVSVHRRTDQGYSRVDGLYVRWRTDRPARTRIIVPTMNGFVLRFTSPKLFGNSFLPFFVAACALLPPPSLTERPPTAGPATPLGERSAPIDVQAALAQTKGLPGDDSRAGLSKAAGHRSDFGLHALQRAKEYYAADDLAAARRNLVEAAAILGDMAASMEPPIRADVWILMNDLRLLRIPEGGANPVMLRNLTDAEARASALAARYAEWVSTRATQQK